MSNLRTITFLSGMVMSSSAWADCPSPFPDKPSGDDFRACFAEISKLREEVKKHSGLPAGVVVAFDLPDGCPEGWNNFEPAISRVIVGAVSGQRASPNHDQDGSLLSSRPFRESGGREKQILTIDQLPPIKFSFNVNAVANAGGDRYDAGGRNYLVVVGNPTKIDLGPIGSSAPISSLPPFVSLYYCKKQ